MSRSPSPPVIVVLGAINMDLVVSAARVPAPGETVVGERFNTTPGGKGANQAVAAANLGAEVRMIGRVGADAFGAELVAGLEGRGIDVRGVAQDPELASGVAMILLDSDRQNYIVAAYGANAACGQAELEAAKGALQEADALLLQLEVPLKVSLEAARYARSRGAKVIWDPAPAVPLPREVYEAVDVLTPNQTEAAALTGIDVGDLDSATASAAALRTAGARAVVVKLGKAGACFAGPEETGHVPAFAVEAVDTVAAGDAFGAALAVAVVEGRSLAEAVRFGSAAGAVAVTRPGAQGAMPNREEVEELMKNGLTGVKP